MYVGEMMDKLEEMRTRLDKLAETSTDYQELYEIRTLLDEANVILTK